MKLNTLAILIVGGAMAQAQPDSEMRAHIRGGGGPDGKCTIEVDIDDSAEVQISGDLGRLRSLSGSRAVWRRFECSSPMPRDMADFRFRGIDGRGRQTLIRDPRSNRGWAVVRLDDPKGGREGYTFDLEWRGGGSYGGPGRGPGYGSGPSGPPSRFTAEKAIAICQEAVSQKLDRDGYRGIRFDRVIPDNNPGRNDWIIGSVDARRRGDTDRFSFSCSVDFSSGRVRSVDVRRR
ncbi:MAG: hypothetical protein HY820_05900 [Acidobacteria bacterium]|nr:hypothetical protein [Acidobacteriota bacterium]